MGLKLGTAFRASTSSMLEALPAALSVLVLVDGMRLGKIVLEQFVVELLAGNPRGFKRPGIFDERRRTGHQLARAPGRKHHVGKLALRSFGLHGHVSLSPQTMPKVPGPAACAVRSNTAAQRQ